jgi:4-hydroxyproline epimerase
MVSQQATAEALAAESSVRVVRVLDTHTGGEPTRVVIEGGPDLGNGPLAERRQIFATQFDHYRRGIACEPRGSDVMVGALLVPPYAPRCVAGVIFFNNVGMLNMCGHGTIGVVVALAQRGQLAPGVHLLDTPVGVVEVEYLGGGRVRLENVPSYRSRTKVAVTLADGSKCTGDIAWGGNWFFICSDHGESLEVVRTAQLTAKAWAIRHALEAAGITGEDGGLIDHIELVGPPSDASRFDAKNFVLCPGGAYDRSPCGTGTSAKVACLAADVKLAEGEIWRQESIVGSHFEGSYRIVDGQLLPTIVGSAAVVAHSDLIFDENDSFCWGINP